jgi:tetratricopeptide (TPR) repeat protein
MAVRIYEEIQIEWLSQTLYYQIEAEIFLAIEDSSKLCVTFEKLYELDGKIQNLINAVVCYSYSCRYDKALELLKQIEIDKIRNDKEKSDIYSLFSQIYLLKEDLDNSYEYIKKAKDIHELHPHESIHQTFFNRALRCGYQDGIKYALDFKEEYPKTSWIKPIIIPENAKGQELINLIKKACGNDNDGFENLLDLYRKGLLSVYHLMVFGNSDLCNVLMWQEFHKLPFRIYNGSLEILDIEKEFISSEILIDALTIFTLSKNDMLNILERFSKIYVTFSTVELIQREYMAMTPYNFTVRAFDYVSKKGLNICLVPNYSKRRTDKETFMFPKSVLDSLEAAKKYNVPYLYADVNLVNYLSMLDSTVNFVSIMAVVRSYIGTEKEYISSENIYNLLSRSYTFVNFSSADIFRVIKNYNL